MIEKPLNLLTIDNININTAYTESSKVSNPLSRYSTKYDLVVCPAFGPKTTLHDSYYKSVDTHYTALNKSVKAMNREFTIDILSKLGIGGHTLFKDLKEKHPDIAAVLLKRMPKDWFEKANAETVAKRIEYKAKVQKQYDELLQIFTEAESKTDLNTMKDINDLYYCEAAGFMSKLEERIFKKNNPKNLKLYNAIQALRNEKTITCTEG